MQIQYNRVVKHFESMWTHGNAHQWNIFSPSVLKTADESWERWICVYKWCLSSQTMGQGRGDIWLKWCKLSPLLNPQRSAVVVDQLLAPEDLCSLGCRPQNAEIRWGVFNAKNSTIICYLADGYVPLNLRELRSFLLNKTPMSKFLCRQKFRRLFSCDLFRPCSSLLSLHRLAYSLLEISRHRAIFFGKKEWQLKKAIIREVLCLNLSANLHSV